ncbi:pentatricopeptide repeat-containing protein At2g40240, mitochondrial-like [Lycium ferocissimum]|uniref:pentatricopeptide repeat-containing protein At2g40240, mitochondrial-like n=1 Tax=Lycium ferocissimum TaxID=112874 RepID=UPI00281527E8|nr:pentatricopeptide repeat-containing protein At2g40240, mitochondrial-like [Lycium ferocissimum]
MLALRKLSTLKSSRFLSSLASIPGIPSCTYYDTRINQAGREGNFETVGHLLNKRVLDGFFNTNNTFKFITTTNLSILNNLLDTISQLENNFARKCSYDCLIARLSKMHCIKEATRVAEVMVSEGHAAANNATFHPIINALTKKEEFDEAWRVLDVMKSDGISPDLTAYNYLLTGYCFIGNLTSAARVVEKIDEEELGADTRTYDALVLGACRAGKLDAALALLRRMVDDGVSPLYCTHTHIINAFLKYNYYELAVEFVRCNAGRDLKLDAENFGVLATKLITRSRFEEAKELVKEMSERRLTMGPRLKDFYELNVRS